MVTEWGKYKGYTVYRCDRKSEIDMEEGSVPRKDIYAYGGEMWYRGRVCGKVTNDGSVSDFCPEKIDKMLDEGVVRAMKAESAKWASEAVALGKEADVDAILASAFNRSVEDMVKPLE